MYYHPFLRRKNVIHILLVIMLVAGRLSGYAQPTRTISLNGPWQFITDPQKAGEKNGYARTLPGKAATVNVPHTWNVQDGLGNYAGLAWYSRNLTAPANWSGKAIFIKFEAVYHDAVIYINGKRVGQHLNSGYTPFSFDISSFLVYGKANKVAVSCDNSFSATNLPYQTAFDWVNDGGIIRDVSLYVCDRPSIRYVHVTPDLNVKDSSAVANVNIKLNEQEVSSADIGLVLKERKSGKVLFSQL